MNLNIDAIADHIIQYSTLLKHQLGNDDYEVMCTGQLSRYVYLTEVAYMQNHNGEPLFEDNFEAWGQGPAINKFKLRFWFNRPMLSEHKHDKLPAEVMATIFAVVQTCGEIFYYDLNEFLRGTDKVYLHAFATGDLEHDKPGIITKEDIYNFYKSQPPILQSLQKFAKNKDSLYDNFVTYMGQSGKADILDKFIYHAMTDNQDTTNRPSTNLEDDEMEDNN